MAELTRLKEMAVTCAVKTLFLMSNSKLFVRFSRKNRIKHFIILVYIYPRDEYVQLLSDFSVGLEFRHVVRFFARGCILLALISGANRDSWRDGPVVGSPLVCTYGVIHTRG